MTLKEFYTKYVEFLPADKMPEFVADLHKLYSTIYEKASKKADDSAFEFPRRPEGF